MPKFKLQKDYFAIVDKSDLDKVNQFKWYKSSIGYAVATIEGTTQFMHRFILGLPKGSFDWVDHKNGNKLDNRKSNLRLVDAQKSRANSRKMLFKNKDCTSCYKGVHKKSLLRNWSAAICYKGKREHLGSFKTEIGAAKAYDRRAKELFREYAKLNFG